jgi:phosphate:Na+ symporter
MASIILLDLMGGVALLLWGLHMVHSGIVRAFGPDLRRVLQTGLSNRYYAFLAGIFVTLLLQSSTAAALMTASFTAGGAIALVPALAIMLGANVGTALIVQVLSFNIAAVAPVFFIAGLVAFRRGKRTRTRDLGRAIIGAGLMLLSLHILLDTLTPAEQAPAVRGLLEAITKEPVLSIVTGAALAYAAHSSVAVVLLIMSLALSRFVMPEAALALVLGANLGSAIAPMLESGRKGDPASRRLPLGNLVMRAAGCLIVIPFLHPIADELLRIEPNPSRMAADFHLAFNLALAVLFIFPLERLAAWLTRLLPEQKKSADLTQPAYLDEAALEMPAVALACAAREVLHTGDIVETMLRQSMAALMNNDRKLVASTCRMDNIVDRLDEAVKLYVTRLTRESLGESDGHRAMEIIAFSINLEHIGDIIDKNLMELASKKIKRRLTFSAEGAAELAAFHQEVLENLKLAFGVFISGDVTIARRLVAEKTKLRNAELLAAECHLARLRDGRPESIESSSLHLDVLRDLKRIHSHICSVAYPVLERAGELHPNRLRSPEAEEKGPESPGGEARVF